jgi:hypothetical protein
VRFLLRNILAHCMAHCDLTYISIVCRLQSACLVAFFLLTITLGATRSS